jgi:hypothetical protein
MGPGSYPSRFSSVPEFQLDSGDFGFMRDGEYWSIARLNIIELEGKRRIGCEYWNGICITNGEVRKLLLGKAESRQMSSFCCLGGEYHNV